MDESWEQQSHLHRTSRASSGQNSRSISERDAVVMQETRDGRTNAENGAGKQDVLTAIQAILLNARNVAMQLLKLQYHPVGATQDAAEWSFYYSFHFFIIMQIYKIVFLGPSSSEPHVASELFCMLLQLYVTQYAASSGITAVRTVWAQKNSSIMFHVMVCVHLLQVSYVYVSAALDNGTFLTMYGESVYTAITLASLSRYITMILLTMTVAYYGISVCMIVLRMRGLQMVYILFVCMSLLPQYGIIGMYMAHSLEKHQNSVGGSIPFFVFGVACGLYLCSDVLAVVATLGASLGTTPQQTSRTDCSHMVVCAVAKFTRIATYVIGSISCMPYVVTLFYTMVRNGEYEVLLAHLGPIYFAYEMYRLLSPLPWKDRTLLRMAFDEDVQTVDGPGHLVFTALSASSWVSVHIFTTLALGLCAVFVLFLYYVPVENIIPGSSLLPLIAPILLSLAAGMALVATLGMGNVPQGHQHRMNPPPWYIGLAPIFATCAVYKLYQALPFAPLAKIPLTPEAMRLQQELGDSVFVAFMPSMFNLKNIVAQDGPLAWIVTNYMFCPMLVVIATMLFTKIPARLKADHPRLMGTAPEVLTFFIVVRVWYLSQMFFAMHLLAYWNDNRSLGTAMYILAMETAYTTLLSWLIDVSSLFFEGSLSFQERSRIYHDACAGKTMPYYRPRSSLLLLTGVFLVVGMAVSAISSDFSMYVLLFLMSLSAPDAETNRARTFGIIFAGAAVLLHSAR